jgi:membrane protein implicated in regulation of membrane protease activity
MAIEDEFTGREGIATDNFGKGKKGRVEFKGTSWTAESEHEIQAGQTVVILSKENVKLIVEPKK